MCWCLKKKQKQEAAPPAGPSSRLASKKEIPSKKQQNSKENSQQNKDAGAKESSNRPVANNDNDKLLKDQSNKKGSTRKEIEDLEGPFASPGPAAVLPKLDPAELKEASEVFPVASLKKDVASGDRSAEKMSLDNTLKEVPKRMPETDIVHDKDSAAQIFTNDQLL